MDRWLANPRLVRVSALLGAGAIAFSSILVKLSHASPSTAAIFRCAFALPLLGLLAWLEGRRYGARPWTDRRIAVAAGVFFAADLILWHHSIDDVGAGLATVLANIQVVIVPLVAWALLAERPGRRVLAALPIALLGVLLISGVLEHGAYGRAPGRGAAFGLAAGIAYVGVLMLLRRGSSDLRRVAGPLFDMTATATVCAVVAGLVVGDADLLPAWPGVGWLIVLALTSQVIGWLLITTSLPRLPVRNYFADAHRPAGWLRGARGFDPRRGADGAAAGGGRGRPGGRDHRDGPGRPRATGTGPPTPGESSRPRRGRPRR